MRKSEGDVELSIVAAMATNGVIGVDGRLPWHLPADLQHFKRLTLGKPILMGRRTHISIGRALPERLNLVMTRRRDVSLPEGCVAVGSIDEAISVARAPELMVIGGESVYREVLPRAARMHLTLVDRSVRGDVYFPEFDENDWVVTARERHPADARNAYRLRFVTLERK